MFQIVGRITPAYVVLLLVSCIFVSWATYAVKLTGFHLISKAIIDIGATVIAMVMVVAVTGDPCRPPFALFAVTMARLLGIMSSFGRSAER